MHVDRVCADWRAWQQVKHLSERTITERERILRQFIAFSGAHPLKFTSAQLIAFLGRKGLAAVTRWTYQTALRSYCAWLVASKRRRTNPMDEVPVMSRPKGVPHPVSPAQLAAMLAHVKRRRGRMMILLAAFMGLRTFEIAAFDGSWIDWGARVVWVPSKGGKTKPIPLSHVVEDYATNAGFPREGLWFPAYQGDSPHVSRKAVHSSIHHVMVVAGVRSTPHSLRHYHATELLENGIDVIVVKEMMRHESVQSTQIYTLVSGWKMQEASNVLQLPAELETERLAA
ncbi:MAG TPA: tyrosine-type recombinase/integrase [Microbacteriaceae bacterium]|nr:tyrosine-type recombinase/integrase [Microbacteriaceae bacterium]